MWKNYVEWGRPQLTNWRMRTECWIRKAKNTDSEYTTIIAFPQEQFLQECASMIHYTYLAVWS